MKTKIEERAKAYEESLGFGYRKRMSKFPSNGFIAGAKSEHEELTRWHDPKEYPKDNREVLAKCNPAHYIIAIYDNEQETWVDAISGRPIRIIGWREIHETYNEAEKSEIQPNFPEEMPPTVRLCGLEWMADNLTGHGGTEVDGRWYYTWDEAMAAAKELGDGWRLPTQDEFQALAEAGSVWDDERKGRLFGGKLFLEAAGYLSCGTGAVADVASNGYYWSSSPFYGGVNAGYLGFISGGVIPLYYGSRAYGFSVRCVREIER